MGLLVDGKWVDKWYNTDKSGGQFVRKAVQFRDVVSTDGSSAFPVEKGRYHLYVSLACPWAHRTLIVRELKGLADAIDISVVDYLMGEIGWEFGEGATAGEIPSGPESHADSVNGSHCLHELYVRARGDYTGRVTVPVLWCKKTNTIVNNESSEIIRMFNHQFDAFAADVELDLYPEVLRSDIDAINAPIYDNINNGVYRCGFATTQVAYEQAYNALCSELDRVEALLSKHRYLVGDQLTEADIRLFTTMVRFDPVYFGHFKCNQQRLTSYPNLWAHTREIYQLPGVAKTVNFPHIKRHYYMSHTSINPTQVVPTGPDINFDEPHGRDGAQG